MVRDFAGDPYPACGHGPVLRYALPEVLADRLRIHPGTSLLPAGVSNQATTHAGGNGIRNGSGNRTRSDRHVAVCEVVESGVAGPRLFRAVARRYEHDVHNE